MMLKSTSKLWHNCHKVKKKNPQIITIQILSVKH